MVRQMRRLGVVLVGTLAVIWATAALYVDIPVPWLRLPIAIVFLILVAGALFTVRRRALTTFGLFAAVLAWWLTLSPSNERPWLPDVAQTPWAEFQGDKVTIHNLRNFDYTTETDYRVNWETRTVDLSQIRGTDLFMNYWGSPAIAHTILSFEFADSPPVAMSIETRKEIGETYSALLGFFRQYELVYVIGDERDIIRVRTNYRQGEDLYLYHTRATPDRARAVFLDYLKTANELHAHSQWYNALTSNCTTNVMPHLNAASDNVHLPWDWRILLNGYADQMSYERGRLEGDLPFDELKRRAHINESARAADKAPDFSRRIREGRPGFQ
jgi:hypothetical protein